MLNSALLTTAKIDPLLSLLRDRIIVVMRLKGRDFLSAGAVESDAPGRVPAGFKLR